MNYVSISSINIFQAYQNANILSNNTNPSLKYILNSENKSDRKYLGHWLLYVKAQRLSNYIPIINLKLCMILLIKHIGSRFDNVVRKP